MGPPLRRLQRRATRALASTIAVLLATSLGACTSSDSDPTPMPSPSTGLARSVPSLASYCEVQELRQLIADGDVDRSKLPNFADMTEVDGTPLILDFKKPPPDGESTTAFVGRLLTSPGLQKVEIDDADRQRCIDTTTDADIERSQGGPGYLANPSAEPTK
jgi:hypothetical protein